MIITKCNRCKVVRNESNEQQWATSGETFRLSDLTRIDLCGKCGPALWEFLCSVRPVDASTQRMKKVLEHYNAKRPSMTQG